jgi:hypothetical protein
MIVTIQRSDAVNRLLNELAKELQVPEARYQQAEDSYHAVSQWLGRPESVLHKYNPEFYSQGSFQLGTVIRPITDEDDYDVDAVCELKIDAGAMTQSTLKTLVGSEIKKYAKSHGMNEEPSDGRRCWTLDYADGAKFHLDILPARPDGQRLQESLVKAHLVSSFSGTAIAITDKQHANYNTLSFDWPFSNPKGYSEWFKSRMIARFTESALAKGIRASVADIPAYRVLTPLQSCIQILKRHRDIMFEGEPDHKPISIILTTLAAHSYQQEDNIPDALFSILSSMENAIELREGVSWISNPSDPRENFADKWENFPEREENFYKWLAKVREDFSVAAEISEPTLLLEKMSDPMGRNLVAKASTGISASRQSPLPRTISSMSTYKRKLFDVVHRKKPDWPISSTGKVTLSLTVRQKGFRDSRIASDGKALPKNCSLTFAAKTNVAAPFRVYWQIVNTGEEARLARSLRGEFIEGNSVRGELTHFESTLYKGAHWVECFIVKDGKLEAKSGEFIVNIS